MARYVDITSRFYRIFWPGGKTICVVSKIDKGPGALLDRAITLKLSFEEVEKIYMAMSAAANELVAQEARTADINARNSGEQS